MKLFLGVAAGLSTLLVTGMMIFGVIKPFLISPLSLWIAKASANPEGGACVGAVLLSIAVWGMIFLTGRISRRVAYGMWVEPDDGGPDSLIDLVTFPSEEDERRGS
jgi:hypothetical protein